MSTSKLGGMPTPRTHAIQSQSYSQQRDPSYEADPYSKPIFYRGGDDRLSSSGQSPYSDQPLPNIAGNPLERTYPPAYQEPKYTQGNDSSSKGRLTACMWRSPRRETASTGIPIHGMMPPQQNQTLDVLTHIKEVHWVAEKSLSILNDLYQDHLATKYDTMKKEATAALEAARKQESPLKAAEITSGLEKVIRETVAETFTSMSEKMTRENTEEMAQLGQQIHRELTDHAEHTQRHVEEQLRERGDRSARERLAQGWPVPKELAEALDSMTKKIDTLSTLPSAGNSTVSPRRYLSTTSPRRQAQVAPGFSDISNLDASLVQLRSPGTDMSSPDGGPSVLGKVENGGTKESGMEPPPPDAAALARSASMVADDEKQQEYDAVMAEYLRDQAIRGSGQVEKPPPIKEDTSFSAVFANDTDLGKPIYDVESLWHTEGLPQALARDHRFGNICNFVIFANAIYLGIDAENNTADNLYDAHLPFIICENIFCVFFTFEFIIRVLAFKHKADILHDGWMRFDGFLVTMMVAETWVLMPALKSSSSSLAIPVAPLRLLRLLKVTRMARMMHAFPELITIIKALFKSIRALSSAMMLVFILLYSFTILIHMLMKDNVKLNGVLEEEVQFNFKTIPNCMWTLFMAGVFMLDGAANIATHLVFAPQITAAISGWLFLFFTGLTAMTVLQMLIGVLCEVVSETNKEHKASKVVTIMKQQLTSKLKQFDDGDGMITQPELATILQDPESQILLRSLNVNQLFLHQMQNLLFPTQDSAVAFKPLTEMLLMCRGDNLATVETMASGFSSLVSEIRESTKMIKKMHHHQQSQVPVQTNGNHIQVGTVDTTI